MPLQFSDGDLVIVSHPLSDYAHLVGRVVGVPSKSMFNVSYFNDREGFKTEVKLRKNTAVTCVLPIDTDYYAVAAALMHAAETHRNAIRDANAAYMKVVRNGGDL